MNLYQITPQNTYEICKPSQCGSQLIIEETFGRVALSQHAVGHEIDLLRMRGQFNQPVRIVADRMPRSPIISIMVFLEGRMSISMEGYLDPLIARKGFVGLFYSPDHDGHMDYGQQSSDFLAVRMSMDRFRKILQQDSRREAHRLFAPIMTRSDQPFRLICQCNANMDRLIQDLLTPHSVFAGNLLRDARSHELFLTVLEEMVRTHTQPVRIDISARDRQKLLEARTLLLDRLENPPTLLELAQQVGLNDFKLKKGFKALFNNTVYGEVQAARMEKARRLLLQGELSITEVSLLVGYSNHGHFSAVFRKRFGMTPREFRRQLQ